MSPERVPPTNFEEYEIVSEGSGWYTYKRTAKWKYHPETGLYLHVKSDVYYVQKDSNPKEFRRIEDDDDPIIRKMKQSEEMRKAINATEFVAFEKPGAEENGEAPATAAAGAPGPTPQPGPASIGPAAPPPAPDKGEEEDKKNVGTVREWNTEKGFGFIKPSDKEHEHESIFVHLLNVVGSSHSNPIHLKEGTKVQYTLGEQDARARAMEVVMLDKSGKPLPVHAGAQRLEEKRKSYYVTADSIGVRFHHESWPGKQTDMTDRVTIDVPMEELGVYFAAFDGHSGAHVSEIASKQLHKNILSHFRAKQVQPASRDEKVKVAIKEAFAQTDKEILALAERKKFTSSGCSALVAMLHGNPKLGSALRLVVAHVGDARAVLCRGGDAIALTDDHRPHRLDEKKRVERAGGLVLNVRGAWRIAAPANPKSSTKAQRREYQGVSITRSLGDFTFKGASALLTPEPEVKIITPVDKDLFVVLATDSIFSVLSNQEVVDLASEHWQDPEAACKNVVRKAFNKGADNNLTAMVIQFGWSDKGAKALLDRRRARVARGAEGGSPKLKPGSVDADTATAVEDDGFSMFG